MIRIVGSQFVVGEFNNYLIGGNLCNSFILGEVGSIDDFFLVGTEPKEESPFPLLTGNILDSEGKVLFRLVRNVPIINPGACLRITGDYLGYEIHDSQGALVFKIHSRFEHLPGQIEEMLVTTLAGKFYNRKKELVFLAKSGGENEHLEVMAKCAFGFSAGEFGFTQDLSQEEIDFGRLILLSRGAIHEAIRGPLESEEIHLDGKALIGAKLTKCTIHVKTGEFGFLGSNAFDGCQFVFHEAADNIFHLVKTITGQQSP